MSNYKIKDRQLANEFYGEHNKPTAEDVGALPISGGTLTGPEIFLFNNNGKVANDTTQTLLMAFDDPNNLTGNRRMLSLFDHTAVPHISKALKYRDVTDGVTKEYTVYGEHNKEIMPFLPLDGGTMSGNVEMDVNGTYGKYGPGWFLTYDDHNKNTYSYLQLLSSKAEGDLAKRVRFFNTVDGTSQKDYNIFGEHNKPSGSYTGNGDATRRTINVGGIGNILAITYDGHFVFVHSKGAFGTYTDGRTTMESFNADTVSFNNGVLTIKSASGFLNGGACQYVYYVL